MRKQEYSTTIIQAGAFKARCLAIMDEVSQTGKSFIVTKRGHPLVKVIAIKEPPSLVGSILREKDIVSPIGEKWDAHL